MLAILYHIVGWTLQDFLLLISGVFFVLWTLYKVEATHVSLAHYGIFPAQRYDTSSLGVHENSLFLDQSDL